MTNRTAHTIRVAAVAAVLVLGLAGCNNHAPSVSAPTDSTTSSPAAPPTTENTAPVAPPTSDSSLGNKVSQSTLESEITSLLSKRGMTGAIVRCRGPLEGRVGATNRCTVTDDGKQHEVVAKVTSVVGSKAYFNVREIG